MDSHPFTLESFYRGFQPKGKEVFHFSVNGQVPRTIPDFKVGVAETRAPSNSQQNKFPLPNVIETGVQANLQQGLSSPGPLINSIEHTSMVKTTIGDLASEKYPVIERDPQKSSNSPNIRYSEAWGDSHQMADSPRTETSTEMEGDGKVQGQNQRSLGHNDLGATKMGDSKTLRRLAQNREAARKSRLRKKAYVQQLESSRIKLSQLEQELQRAREQGYYVGGCTSDPLQLSNGANNTNGALNPGAAFDMDYAHWMEEHERQMSDLRSSLQTHAADNVLRILVETMISHYDDIFRLKSSAAKKDVFHLTSGMWKSPAERCFLWMGGHRPSELLKIVIPHLEPVTDQQSESICSLQQSSQQAEDALSQGMEALQQSLSETLSSGSLSSSSNVANYMGQMAMAMGKLGTLENLVRQADNLRHQTLQQMHRILTTRQSARGLLAMGEYCARLRALSSLWLARPRE